MTKQQILLELEGLHGPNVATDANIAFFFRHRPQGQVKASFEQHERRHGYEAAWIAHRPWRSMFGIPVYTADLNAAVALVHTALPGWIWRMASCSVSDDAWVIPDFNHPIYGRKLRKKWPSECQKDPVTYLGTDVDRRPPGHPQIALLESIFRALIKKDAHHEK